MDPSTSQFDFGAPLGDDFGPGARLEFTIAGGAVTGVQIVDNGHTHTLTLASNESFALSGADVVETVTGAQGVTTLTYAPETSDPSLYSLATSVETVTVPTTALVNGATAGLSFTLSGGAVTAEQSNFTFNGQTHTETVPLPAASVFAVTASGVTETLVHGDAVETLQYVLPAGGTLYALASDATTYIPQGAATTALDVNAEDRVAFTVTAGGTVTAEQAVHPDGSTSALHVGSGAAFTQLAPGYVEELNTYGGHSSYEVFYAGANSNGVYTEVAHGAGSTVDLTGLEAQIAQLPSSSGWII